MNKKCVHNGHVGEIKIKKFAIFESSQMLTFEVEMVVICALSFCTPEFSQGDKLGVTISVKVTTFLSLLVFARVTTSEFVTLVVTGGFSAEMLINIIQLFMIW